MRLICAGMFLGLPLSLVTGCCSKPEATVTTHVACRAILLEYDEEHPWFDNQESGHDDGVAPLATFRIMKPETHWSREMSILFNSPRFEKMLPIMKHGAGETFLIDVPEGFLTGNATIIEALHVYAVERDTS